MTKALPDVPVYLRRDVLDPTPALADVRDSVGVHEISAFGVSAYLVTGYDRVKAALADPVRFANRKPPGTVGPGGVLPTGQEYENATAGNLLGTDPPEHQRLRRLLTPEFTVRRMRRLEPRIVEIVDEHLDAMERAGGPIDLVSSFALPIPSLVICELLGVPYDDREDFQRRSARQLDFSTSIAERQGVQRESREYMLSLVRHARREPGDDILGMLVREHGTEITDYELAGIAGLLLIAGHETTSNMLGLGTIALLRSPDQLTAVREDPDAVGPAMEELLRYLSVVQNAIPRITTTEVEVDGVTIPSGSLVILSLPSANRDPAFIDRPDTLDVRRGAPGHLAFGHGIHHCLGAPLARMEMRVAFPALLRRFPNLALVDDVSDIAFRPFNLIYGAASLRVAW